MKEEAHPFRGGRRSLSEDELYSLRKVAPDVFNIHPDLVNDIRYCLQQASSLI
jgi:hypothetical protein